MKTLREALKEIDNECTVHPHVGVTELDAVKHGGELTVSDVIQHLERKNELLLGKAVILKVPQDSAEAGSITLKGQERPFLILFKKNKSIRTFRASRG